MSSFRALLWSSLGKKYLTGATGILLVIYIIGHLVGNLTLLIGPHAFNEYAHFLENLAFGTFVIAFEIALITVFLLHMLYGVAVALVDKPRARPVKYAELRNAGGASHKGLASRSMIITGIVLIVFVVWHVWHFKFGERGIFQGEGGRELGDLHGVVVAAFKTPWIVAVYVAVMILLGLHLRHGFWSMFQSLGLTGPRSLNALARFSLGFAIVWAGGFVLLPLYVYFRVEPGAAAAAAGGH
jgi:succinate dehydrogenase / fumarate reductase, cytochrome b subunit